MLASKRLDPSIFENAWALRGEGCSVLIPGRERLQHTRSSGDPNGLDLLPRANRRVEGSNGASIAGVYQKGPQAIRVRHQGLVRHLYCPKLGNHVAMPGTKISITTNSIEQPMKGRAEI